MPDFAIAGETVFPTTNDVGQIAGDGKHLREISMRSWLWNAGQLNIVTNGLSLPTSSLNLTATIAPGEAIISGYLVSVPSSTVITVLSNSDSFVYLKLVKDGLGHVTSAAVEVNTLGSQPPDSVLLGRLISSASAITSRLDWRPRFPFLRIPVCVTFHASTTYQIPAGITRIFVQVWGASGGGGGGGGGGGAGSGTFASPGGNGGRGGAGAYTSQVLDVHPFTVFTITIGVGGGGGGGGGAGTGSASGNPGGSGTSGGFSSVVGGGISVIASGGLAAAGGSGGAGGSVISLAPSWAAPSGQDGGHASLSTGDLISVTGLAGGVGGVGGSGNSGAPGNLGGTGNGGLSGKVAIWL